MLQRKTFLAVPVFEDVEHFVQSHQRKWLWIKDCMILATYFPFALSIWSKLGLPATLKSARVTF